MKKVIYTIKNLNKEKIFKELLKITKIYNINIKNSEVSFCIKGKDEKNIDKILNKKNIKICNKRNVGIFNFLNINVFKLSIIIPIFIFFIFIIFSNNYVFQYNIYGLNTISNSEIINILEDCGVDKITYKKAINTKDIENKIQKIDRVSLVSVAIKGNTLLINIKEKLYNPEYEDKENFKPIYAEYDGIITELVVVQGTPKVKVGQLVQKGQILVSPIIQDTSGNTREVNPLADIKADIYYSTITDIATSRMEYIDTGKTTKKRQIYMGDNIIFDDGLKCDYKFYRAKEVKQYLSQNNLLPLLLIETVYFEQKQEFNENYFEQNKQTIIDECKKKTRQLFSKYEIIKEEYYEITNHAGINRITYTCVVNSSII